MSVLPEARSYEELVSAFRWDIPRELNIATVCCDRHAAGGGTALIVEEPDGGVRAWSFAELSQLSSRLGNALRAKGVRRGDRVAILMGQRVETLIAHLAIYRLGAIALPLFSLFGPEAIGYRLADSGAAALVTDPAGAAGIEPLRETLPALRLLVVTDGGAPGAESFWPLLEAASDRLAPVPTLADDPAVLIYTSGTTGNPKGALHAHRVLLGHLPGVQMPQELFPQPGDRFWTPADWAWIGGLFDVLMPSLFFGVPVVAGRAAKFDPEAAASFMARHEIRNLFLPPTALRLMQREEVNPLRAGARLRSIGSGGERLGEEQIAWVDEVFGCPINEFYGQTEANLLVSSCRRLFARRPGSMGRAVPGHVVAILDEDGQPAPAGTAGAIAVRAPDPVMFLGYWNNPAATADKFRGDWLVTGDMGRVDEEGYLAYLGREDDLINSAGYRIGPGEIEECLMRHPAVSLCAVVGVPDPLRGERVKAYVVTKPGVAAGEPLAAAIQDFVRQRLAAHEYPREVAFVEALPLTATGKVRRSELRARDTGQPAANDRKN
ncbi:acyl-CoA synthetase [Marinimicrococcus flavescens]|uniref:Acyl-CoA synthetase n=1 Tax=Marinimicrococcus flavescens TaxID=3031815 RepID=A0AAP3UZA7_9PROT|nr:acyl-CoA synthetase [Marinimicrococcus flavescens]